MTEEFKCEKDFLSEAEALKQRGCLFTPRLGNTQERLQLTLSMKDVKIKLTGAIVTDLNTGKRYRAWPAPCGLTCYCDAMAFEIPE